MRITKKKRWEKRKWRRKKKKKKEIWRKTK